MPEAVFHNLVAHVTCGYNNTIITFAREDGRVVAQSSPGELGYKGPRQSTPHATSEATRKAIEKVLAKGKIGNVEIRLKGPGSGREPAVRAIAGFPGVTVVKLSDVTPIPHNGCDQPNERNV